MRRATFTRSGSPRPGIRQSRPSTTSFRPLPGEVRCEVRGGVQRSRQGPGRPPGILRLPGRALGPPADDQPDREHLRDDPPAASPHEGQRLEEGESHDDVQARSVRQPTLAKTQRSSPTCSCSRRKNLHRRSPAERRLIQDRSTQLLTIAQHPGGERSVRRMTNSIRPFVAASQQSHGEAQLTSALPCLKWVEQVPRNGSDGTSDRESRPNDRSDRG